MGVPGYFARLIRKTPRAVTAEPTAPCGRLYIDFNSLVHRQVTSGAQSAQDVIDRTVEYLRDTVVRAARLEQGATLFIAADGAPPLSKMMQQRSRRFVARYVSPDSAGAPEPSPDAFQRSDITPGTPFASRLDAAMRTLADAMAATGEYGAVIYSGTDAPGEGEHKIMHDIRAAGDLAGAKNFVYGLDADLLLLTMLHGAGTGSWPVVMREADAVCGAGAGGSMRYVDVREVASKMAGGLDPRSVRNHVICSFLCGNDFLPPASCLSVHDGWIETLGSLSRDLDLASDSRRDGLIVDSDQLEKLLCRLASREDSDFFRADERYWRANPRVECEEDAWNSYPLLHKDDSLRSIRPGTGGWRFRFYARVMGIRHCDDIAGACASFVSGIAWCASYYSGGFGNPGDEPSWFYPYHYGPCSVDLANALTLSSGALEPPCPSSGYPTFAFSPDSVRDFVIPPGDRQPRKLPWAYLFPTGFKIGTYLRHKVWHCAAELPFPLDVARDVCRRAV